MRLPQGESEPKISVVLMADQQRARCARVLRSLVDQRLAGGMEILLLDFGEPDELDEIDQSRVRRIECRKGLGFGEALALGVSHARAPVVAFVEEHAVAAPGWAQALVEAHEGEWAAVGPEVSCDNLDRGSAQLIELISHGPWSPPARRSETAELRWQNVSYKTQVLRIFSSDLPLFLNAEGALFERFRLDGHRLLLEPTARLRHSNETSFRAFLRGSYLSNRLSAASRARLLEMNRLQRGLRICNASFAPLRSAVRLYRGLSRSGSREQVPRFWRSLPGVLLYYCVLAVSVQVGYLLGAGDSASRFLDYELNQYRGIDGLEEKPIGT